MVVSSILGFPNGFLVKNLPAVQEMQGIGFNLWFGKIPWSKKWQPTQVLFCEKPWDKGVWWAIVQRVRKSRTQLNPQGLNVYIGYLPLRSCDWLGVMVPWLFPASRGSILLQVAGLGKGQNSKYTVYYISIIFTYISWHLIVLICLSALSLSHFPSNFYYGNIYSYLIKDLMSL